MTASEIVSYVETPTERRQRVALEQVARRRARQRYRIQINLKWSSDWGAAFYPACSIPVQFTTPEEAWRYVDRVNPMKFFPNARSLSVERCA